MITRDRSLYTSPPDERLLISCWQEFAPEQERMMRLWDAYRNKRSILQRKREDGLPNNRLAHGFARYIATVTSSYLLGKPVDYQAANGNETALDAVLEAYKHSDVQSVDAELARNAAIFGKGVEIILADEDSQPRTASMWPGNAFVVYDDTVNNKPIFGMYAVEVRDIENKVIGWKVHVLDEQCEYVYDVQEPGTLGYGEPEEVTPHWFGVVPIVEYWNNEDEAGDFEQVEPLIDAYDVLESDRVNDKQQFVDALLVMTGARLETDEKGRTPGQQLRQDKILFLPDSEAKAEYLARSMSDTDTEVLRASLKEDIHKFSFTPDLSDVNFSGNASGVAMRYKLFMLEQLIANKERWFREALRERLRAFNNFLSVKGAAEVDVEGVQMIFQRALPVNDLEVAQTLSVYAGSGIVPEKMLMAQVPFIDNADEAAEMIQQQRDEAEARQARAFGAPEIPDVGKEFPEITEDDEDYPGLE